MHVPCLQNPSFSCFPIINARFCNRSGETIHSLHFWYGNQNCPFKDLKAYAVRTFGHPVAVVEPVMIDGGRQNRKAATPQNTRRCLVIVVESCAACRCQTIVFATRQTSCVLMPNVGAVVVTKIFLGSCPFTCEVMCV